MLLVWWTSKIEAFHVNIRGKVLTLSLVALCYEEILTLTSCAGLTKVLPVLSVINMSPPPPAGH